MPVSSVMCFARAKRAVPLVALALAASACTSLTDAGLSPNRYAAVNVLAKNAANNRATANATMVVFEAFTPVLPNSLTQQSDQCVFAAVDTSTSVTRGVKKAGESVSLAVGATSVSMPFDAAFARYANAAGAPFSYGVGDVAQVTVPGDPAVYPAASISVKLAEPIVPGAVSIPAGTEPMVFTWNATNDSTAAVILSLRYANPANSTYANEQIYCALKDDGTHQISTTALANFLASPASKRSFVMTRWRTKEALVDSRTGIHIVSSVDTTVVFQP